MPSKEKNKLAVFDIDGTIFRKNLAFELIDELVWMKVFDEKARSILTHSYTNWLEHKGVYEDYRKDLVRVYGENIKGCCQMDVGKACREVMPFHKDRTYIFAESLIKKFRSENYKIIAISGSPMEIVEEYNKYLKFDDVFGTIYEMNSKNIYTGNCIFEPTKDKGQVVRQYVAEKNLTLEGSYGIGDTESDIKMLEAVENPIAFNPNYNLKQIAQEKNWRIVVEKKDVIYEINKDN